MKVLLLNSFYYRRGGAEIHVLDLEQHLKNRRHEVAVFAMQHPENLPSPWSGFFPSNVEYARPHDVTEALTALGRVVYSRESARNLDALLKEFKPDVAHVHCIHHHLSLSVLDVLRTRRVPIVWTLHDFRPVCPNTDLVREGAVCEECGGGRLWNCVRYCCKSGSLPRSLAAVLDSTLALVRKTYDTVDCFISPSEFLARKVSELGLRAQRMEVLPNFIAPDGGDPSLDARNGVLYVGRLSPEKGAAVLIEASSSLGESLTIVGDGPAREELTSLAQARGVAAQFPGWLDARGVRQAMAQARVLAVPSLWYENCPLVVLEGMGRRVPIVASDLGGMHELLDGGRCGWLARPGDASDWARVLTSAWADRERSADLVERAYARLQSRHGVEGFMRRLEEVYQSLLSADSRASGGVA